MKIDLSEHAVRETRPRWNNYAPSARRGGEWG